MQQQCLSRNNLYMLPTRHGLIFTLVLLAMLLVAVNYNNSLAYMMTFTLASCVLISMLYTHRNLHGLCISYGVCSPAFAGSTLKYTLIIENKTHRDRYDVGIEVQGGRSNRRDFSSEEKWQLDCKTLALRRGWQALPAVQVNTRYPLGLLFSWSKRLNITKSALIYPQAADVQVLPQQYSDKGKDSARPRINQEDYSGLRAFRIGDPPQHIDWKSYARGKGMYSKEFLAGESPEMVFRWDELLGNEEQKLSTLTAWVLLAMEKNIVFALEIPGISIAADNSEKHREKCLKALALF